MKSTSARNPLLLGFLPGSPKRGREGERGKGQGEGGRYDTSMITHSRSSSRILCNAQSPYSRTNTYSLRASQMTYWEPGKPRHCLILVWEWMTGLPVMAPVFVVTTQQGNVTSGGCHDLQQTHTLTIRSLDLTRIHRETEGCHCVYPLSLPFPIHKQSAVTK